MPISVLIVDDSEDDQLICNYIVESYNENSAIAQVFDGQEAIEYLESDQQKPDYILLDINMPRMDGFEFLEHFKTDFFDKGLMKNTRIIMLSSSINERDMTKSNAYPFVSGAITKPITVDNLGSALAN